MVSWQVFMNILVCLLFFFFVRVEFWIYFSLLTKKEKKKKNYLQLSKPQLRMPLSRIVGKPGGLNLSYSHLPS